MGRAFLSPANIQQTIQEICLWEEKDAFFFLQKLNWPITIDYIGTVRSPGADLNFDSYLVPLCIWLRSAVELPNVQCQGWSPVNATCCYSMESCTHSVWPCCWSYFRAARDKSIQTHTHIERVYVYIDVFSSFLYISTHLWSTSPAAGADGPFVNCRRSWALGCCRRLEAE